MGVTSNWCHPQGHHARRPPTTVPRHVRGCKNILVNATKHVKSKAHQMNAKKGASTSKKLTSFFTQKPRLSQPQDISKKQLWHGFYQRHVTFREGHCTVEVDISLLLEDNVPGKDMNTLSWYSDRHYKVDEKTVGTFRSPECAKIGFFEDNTCVKCAGIPKLQSFRKRALLRH